MTWRGWVSEWHSSWWTQVQVTHFIRFLFFLTSADNEGNYPPQWNHSQKFQWSSALVFFLYNVLFWIAYYHNIGVITPFIAIQQTVQTIDRETIDSADTTAIWMYTVILLIYISRFGLSNYSQVPLTRSSRCIQVQCCPVTKFASVAPLGCLSVCVCVCVCAFSSFWNQAWVWATPFETLASKKLYGNWNLSHSREIEFYRVQ